MATTSLTTTQAVNDANVADARAALVSDISDAEEELETTTAALDGTLIISRGEDVTAAEADTATDEALTAATAEADEAAVVALALSIRDEGENATLDADGTFNDGGNGDDVDAGDDVALFTVTDGTAALNDEVVSVNEDDYLTTTSLVQQRQPHYLQHTSIIY